MSVIVLVKYHQEGADELCFDLFDKCITPPTIQNTTHYCSILCTHNVAYMDTNWALCVPCRAEVLRGESCALGGDHRCKSHLFV